MWLQEGDMGRNWLCPQVPPGVPLLGAAVLRRSQRDGEPVARLAYLDGLGQCAILAAENCQGPAKQTLLLEPDCLGTSAAPKVPLHAKGQGSPLLLLQVLPACQGNQSKTP